MQYRGVIGMAVQNDVSARIENKIVELERKNDGKFDKLLSSLERLSNELSALCVKLDNSNKNMERVENEQERMWIEIDKTSKSMITLSVRQENVVATINKVLPTIFSLIAAVGVIYKIMVP